MTDFQIHTESLSSAELRTVLVDDIECGGGLIATTVDDGADTLTDIFAIEVVMVNGDHHRLLLATAHIKFLLSHLIQYGQGRIARGES